MIEKKKNIACELVTAFHESTEGGWFYWLDKERSLVRLSCKQLLRTSGVDGTANCVFMLDRLLSLSKILEKDPNYPD